MVRARKIELSTRESRRFLAHQWKIFNERWFDELEPGPEPKTIEALSIARNLLSHFKFVHGHWMIPKSSILRKAKRLMRDAPSSSKIPTYKFHNEFLIKFLKDIEHQRTQRFFLQNPHLTPAASVSGDLRDVDYQVRSLRKDERHKFAFFIWCSLQFYLRSDITKDTLFAGKTSETPFLWQEAERMTRARLNFKGSRSNYGIIQRTIMDKDRWREAVCDRITDLSSYTDEEITRLAIVCLKDVEQTVVSYMMAKLQEKSFNDWLSDRKNSHRQGSDDAGGTDDTK